MNGTSCTGNSSDEFADAKTHYNPQNCPHPYHAGDLPPLIENDGYSYMSVFINKFTVKDIIGKVGHSSVQTTDRVYSHFFEDEFKNVPNVMEEFLTVKAN